MARPRPEAAADPNRSAWWLKTLHRWHWISSAISLVALLVFAATGITLNHAAQIEAEAQVVTVNETLPSSVLRACRQAWRRRSVARCGS